ncbi:mechanosensitive ion channel domain-containing protein [Desulfospira joergensenii]|uniref:mechanosensitive ion channel domain-containing protein n=1 Tax=Desulfospira joergensenii TaxID=53329 RepID=UPI0003B6E3C9|nr:mechanosensitive ion channel domain-containing protein [Desulfospira joergensenii]
MKPSQYRSCHAIPALLRTCLMMVGILFFLLSPLLIQADEKESKMNGRDLPRIEEIEEKINILDRKLDPLLKTQTGQLADELNVTRDQIQQKAEMLTKLNSAYLKLKNAVQDLKKAKEENQTSKKIYEDFRSKGMTAKPPYSLAFYDSIKVEISTTDKIRQSLEFTIEMQQKDIEDHKGQLSQKESELRQFNEKRVKAEGDRKTGEAVVRAEILETAVLYLKTFLEALEIEKQRYELDITNLDIQSRLLFEQEQYVKSNIHYDKTDLDHQLDILAAKKKVTAGEIERLRSDQKLVEVEWGKAQHKLALARDEAERNLAQAYLKARDEWRQTYNIVLEMKRDSLALLDRQQLVWKNRYAIVKGDLNFQQQKEIRLEAEKRIKNLSQTLQIQQSYLSNLQNQISSIENLIQEQGQTLAEKKYLNVVRDALKRRFERRLEYQSLVISTDQLEQNLLAQIKTGLDDISIRQQMIRFLQIATKMWNLEVWVVDQHSVSLGKILVAILILIMGSIFARFLMGRIHTRLLKTSQFKETTVSALHKGLSYFAYLLVFLFALRIVNIPLTAFAFLGGAVAIGLGFGAQNLINNFISGFIILGERPIQIGDLIEVEGVLGKVEEIGARCTRVRTGENIHKLIPNSSFLEKNITNWTLSDNRIRTKIAVGVAYGSPVDKVEKTLLKSVESNAKVLKFPEPFVIFSDFGDNSLVFEVYFWVMIRMVLEKKMIESRVRFEIDALFKQENIVIAFPQRDIHFDRPLSINLTREPDVSGPQGQT